MVLAYLCELPALNAIVDPADVIPPLLLARVDAACAELRPALSHWSDEQWQQARRVWAASRFVQTWCVQNPTQIDAMLAGEAVALPQTQDLTEFDAGLRQHRNQVMAGIAYREIAGLVSPEATVTALSALADACVQHTVAWHQVALRERYGVPRGKSGEEARFVVLALGKLGGRELNFSSDIDLIFAYTSAGESDGAKVLDNESYFVRLGQRVNRSLELRSEHGFVFRVDLRLRPFGEQGPICHSFASIEEYYEVHGRGWERYAWIKARAIAGDVVAGRNLIQVLQPFVYRRYLDFGAIASLREMKAQIDEQVRKRGHEQDIKLGWGGIREVEFIVQVFQLVRGGAEPSLRSNSLMKAMRSVEKLDLHPADSLQALREAYWFLRRLENCWQAQDDQQSHVLPDNEEPRMALACALGYASWGALDAVLGHHRAIVHAQFSALFAQTDDEHKDCAWVDWWEGQDAWPGTVAEPAFLSLRERAYKRLTQEADRVSLGRVVAQLAPLLDGEVTALRVLQVLEVLIGRGNYVSLLEATPVARRQLLELCSRSAWLAKEMRQFPMVLSELLDPVRLYAPDEREVLRERLTDHLANLPVEDVEARMDVLRRMRHGATLRIAAADVAAAIPIMRVSDRLSELAEEILAAALNEAVLQMRRRYPDIGELQFAVIGYGKLGGLELGYTSDLDLVFVYDDGPQELPLDPQVFYTRLAQKMIHFLATPTGAGMAYEIDTRLRPSGASGLLVTRLQALESYQRERAWTWEHQALIRARPVAGSVALGDKFMDLRRSILAIPRDRQHLLGEVQDMRERMHAELAPKDGSFDAKQSRGGIVDIEFLTQFAVLARAAEFPDVSRYTDVVRILESLVGHDLMSKDDAQALADAYRYLRARVHERFLTGATPADDAVLVRTADVLERIARVQPELAA